MIYEQLNDAQRAAVDAILAFLASGEEYYLLQGYAGTGKTFCMQAVVEKVRGRLIFTAPTNKATKVLRDTLTSDAYKPECRTIYSLLGLRMEANGEVKEITAPEDPVDLSTYRAVVVDEGSMVSAMLYNFIRQANAEFGVKFIFMGDPAQLPPVGELRSPIWGIEPKSELANVVRNAGPILEFCTAVRKVVDHPAPRVAMTSANDGTEGVWAIDQISFERKIIELAEQGHFSRPNHTKVIAWRNVTVDKYNRIIRSHIFDNTDKPWAAGDRIIAMAPCEGLNDETFATTDDEGTVGTVVEDVHPLYPDFKIWRISATLDDNSTVVFRVLHGDSLGAFAREKEVLANEARMNKRLWGKFWAFQEAFHPIRHAYAITAHRAQGSTYQNAFVDWRDILLNRNRQEAYRCLYVAASRPKKILYLG